MRIVVVRRKLASRHPRPGDEHLPSAQEMSELFDSADIPDGTPFLIEESGDLNSLRKVNSYLLEAARQRAYAGNALHETHARILRRLLLFVRDRQGQVDLTATERADLVAYRDARQAQLAPGSWNTELSSIASFFSYAVVAGWMPSNPVPKWGTRQRNTLASRVKTHRRERYLTEPQLRLYLEAGLRGDPPADPGLRPRYPERDYLAGLLLVSTGLRREEGCLLLECEIPTAETMHPSGVYTFTRVGKGSRPRTIWITDTFVDIADVYRETERKSVIEAAQTTLRKRRREGDLLMVDVSVDEPGRPMLIIGGHQVLPERLSNVDRARAATLHPDGRIEPLAFIAVQGGRPPALRTLNLIFNDASTRLVGLDHADLPPSHLDVTPHVMRHTFAVRMLAALMREGRENYGNPYHLLASPEFVVQELLGHSDIETTLRYLRAASRYTEDLPNAMRASVSSILGNPGGRMPRFEPTTVQ